MPDRSYFEAEDFATREPEIEKYALIYVNAYPQYDIVTARQIVDAHPTTQGLLGRTETISPPFNDGSTPTPITEVAPAHPKVGAHEWMGEVLDLEPQVGYELMARYRAAASMLHTAKEQAKAIEEEIMATVGGYESAAINGQVIVTWPWVSSTSFDTKTFKEDPARKALYDSFLRTKPTRRFKVTGVVGVD